MALQEKDGFGNWTGTGRAVVCWRACVRACSTWAVFVQHRLLLSANWEMLLVAGGESVSSLQQCKHMDE